MKVLKKILIILLVIIAIPLVVALFVKKEYSVEREVTVNKPSQEVFNYVKHLKNQDRYNKWIMMDPKMKKETKGTDGTVGFIYAWDSSEVGKGEQEIKSVTEGRSIETELRFIEPFEGLATARLTTEAVSPDQTKVRWTMAGKSNYPMNITNLFTGNLLGKDLETSLVALKSAIEE